VLHNDVECYLWKNLIHPFNTRRRWLYPLEVGLHLWYSQGLNQVLRDWIKDATVIIIESGIAPIFFDLIKRLNPRAKVIYRASDSQDTINVANYVKRTFKRIAADINAISLPSRALAETIPSHKNLVFVPHGIDHRLAEHQQPTPYSEGLHAVSVGSMLFDPQFFVIASQHFPQVQFHIIGCGHPSHPDYGDNVRVYGEMPFEETLRYIRHAHFGIAPYASDNLPAYLKDTSMKLIQYDFFGLPAVCPKFVSADYSSRFGYHIGEANSIIEAINLALKVPRPMASQQHLSWSEVTDRMLTPEHYSDTVVAA